MPHLMNCPHSGDGWCLNCVKKMHGKITNDNRSDHVIIKVESTASDVKITLASGVVMHISSNPNSFHCHFSGTKGHIVATPFANHPGVTKLESANYMDLEYTKSKD